MFNDGVWDLDDAGNLIFKWVDNAVVTMVTSVHTLDEVVVRSRRRPRVTVTNRNHIRAVWGDSPRADVSILRAIDDYNDLMGGVDLFDQLRSYHEQRFRVHRNWVPMFLFTFNSAVTNAYIIHKGTHSFHSLPTHLSEMHLDRNDDPLTHTQFVMQWALALKTRSYAPRSRRASQIATHPVTKRRRISSSNPTLPASRLFNVHTHKLILPQDGSSKRRRCAYCSYRRAMAKNRGEREPPVRKVRTICSKCQVSLCQECFSDYHNEQ